MTGHRQGGWWLLAAALATIGCAAPQARPRPALPRIGDVASRLPRELPPEMATPRQPGPRLRVERVDLALEAPMDEPWSLLDTSGLSRSIVEVWRVNGMRVGVLTPTTIRPFLEALPEASGGNAQMIYTSDWATPLLRSPPLDWPVAVDLTVPPRPVREIVLSPDGPRRIQMLVDAWRDAVGRTILTLTPHHFVPQQSLEVRSAEQKQLDGRILSELALSLALGRDQVLVVGLATPPPLQWPLPPSEGPPPDIPAGQQAQVLPESARTPLEPATPRPGSPRSDPMAIESRLPPHLGRALFAATRFGQPIQMVFLIRIAD